MSSNHSISLPNYPGSQSTNEEVISTSQNLFDDQGSESSAQELCHRLSQQQRRLIQLYGREIERRQSTPELLSFIDQIDRLINEYESRVSMIGNSIRKSIENRSII